jgi:hypothetical protein
MSVSLHRDHRTKRHHESFYKQPEAFRRLVLGVSNSHNDPCARAPERANVGERERTYERVLRYVYPSGRHANSSTDSSGRQKDNTAGECLCSRYYRPKRKCGGVCQTCSVPETINHTKNLKPGFCIIITKQPSVDLRRATNISNPLCTMRDSFTYRP